MTECRDSCERQQRPTLGATPQRLYQMNHCTGRTYIMHDDLVLVSTSTYDTGGGVPRGLTILGLFH